MPLPRRSHLAVVIAVGLAAVFILSAAGRARADDAADASTLGGFTLLARANPVQFTYDSPGLLPVSPIIQVSAPESIATLSSGPTGFSRSSVAFPGPLIADLASAIKQEGPECQPPFPVPTYPLRAEAFFPQGPTDSDNSPVPGARQHSTASGVTATAFSAYDDLAFPTVFSMGSIAGTSSSTAKGATAVTKAHSVISGFALPAAALTIDSIVTDITATSTGDKAHTEGTTKVSGVKIAGQAATIDENGLSLKGKAVGGLGAALAQAGMNINQALKQSGIDIHLTSHHETKEDGLGERIADGLVINIFYDGTKAPVLSTILAAVPAGQLSSKNLTTCAPSSPQALFNLLKDTHIESLALGAATVSSNATPGFVIPDLSGSSGDSALVGGATGALAGDLTGATAGAGPGLDTTSGNGLSNSAALGSAADAGTTGPDVSGSAIPAFLALLAIALVALSSMGSQRLADASLAVTAAATTCPLGEGDT